MQLLINLRKLDCYKLQVEDLHRSDIGVAVATLAAQHPKQEVCRLATSLLQKWRDMVESALFQTARYDVVAAGNALDGEPVAPEDLIAAEKNQQRREKLERRRLRIEEDFMAVTSSDDEKGPLVSQDPEWAPQTKRSTGSTHNFRRSRAARLAAMAARDANESVVKIDEDTQGDETTNNDDPPAPTDEPKPEVMAEEAPVPAVITKPVRTNHILHMLQRVKS
jgi:hypothetical protein